MRRELPGTYSPMESGGLLVQARTPEGGRTHYEISPELLVFDVYARDTNQVEHSVEVNLRPVTFEAIRLDTRFPSDLHIQYLAALNCYTGLSTPQLIDKVEKANPEEMESFLVNNVVSTGHMSVVEHRGPSFLIDCISRACSHQLVRQRLFSFSQQSQRYLDVVPREGKNPEMVLPFIIPPSIRADRNLTERYIKYVGQTVTGYYELRTAGAYPEDARFLLPNAAATRIVVSGNWRTWMEMIPKRTCARAQWEIDMVVTDIARQLAQERPGFMKNVGPACSKGKCDQGKRSCGNPLKEPITIFANNEEYPHDRLIFGMR